MKTLKIIPFLVSAAIFISACNTPKTDTAKTSDTTIATPILTGKIDTNTAKRWIKRFAPRVHKFGKDSLTDTRCVWFPKEQLKAMLASLDNIKGGDGVRFYLATYDKTPPLDSKIKFKQEYGNYSTLVMVTTRQGSGLLSGKHFDYYKDTTKLLNGKQVIDTKHSGVIMSVSPENQGELCPPPAKCDTQGATLLEQ